jgi:hypothetical protein
MRGFSPFFGVLRNFCAGTALFACGVAGAQALGKQPTVLPTGNWPVSVVAGDGPVPDGLVDLVYCDPPIAGVSAGCHLLRGDGKGGFSVVENYASPVAARQFTAAFANFSPTLHQVVTLSAQVPDPQGVNFLVQGGGGAYQGNSFTMQGSKQVVPGPVQYFVYSQTGDPVADNNRGFLVEDLANGYVYSTSDLGEPRFTMQLSGGAGPLLVGDLNGDGNNDFVVLGSSDNAATVYLGAGDGSFVPGTSYTLPSEIFSMLLADVNGDGKPDLVVEGANGALSAFLAMQGGFSSKAVPLVGAQDGAHGSGGHLVGIADLNGDGIADIVTSTPAGVSVLLGQGGLTYKAGPSYNAGPGRSSYALADFNGDGKLDLAVDSPEGIALLYGDGVGGFDVGVTANTGQPAYSLALGKFTGSGNTDAVVATGTPQVQLMEGDGKGNFTAASSGPTPAGVAETNAGRTVWSHVVAGDFDGDGKLDAAVSLDGPVETDLGPCCSYGAGDNGMSVLFGDGTGNYSAPMLEGATDTGPHYGMSIAADINNDGYSDLINYDFDFVGGYTGSAGVRADGMVMSNEFAVGQNTGYLFPYQQVATGYFKVGRTSAPDVVVEMDASALSFSAQRNPGNGVYTNAQQTFEVPAGVANLTPGSSVLPTAGLYMSAMALQDIDGDGNGDLLVMYHNLASDPANPSATAQNLLYIFWGNGDGTFEATPEILTLSRNYYQMAVADVDGDGKPDLVLSDGYIVSVLAGTGTRAGFGPETHYLAGMGINALAVADVNGDGKMDVVVANGGAVLSAGVVNNGVLAANAEVNTGGLTVLTSGPAATPPALLSLSGTVTATPEPSIYGAAFTLTATLTPPAAGVAPGGSVTFSIDGTVVGTAQPVSGGVATESITTATITTPITNSIYWDGTHTLTAAYSGDTVYSGATFQGAHTVNGQPTVSTLTDLDQSLFYGQEIGYDNGINALIAAGPADPANAVPGTTLNGANLVVYIDGSVVCQLPYADAGACPDPPFENFPAGVHTTYVMYQGNEYYAPSVSATYDVTIAPDPTTATLTSSVNPSVVGQAVTFTATIGDVYHVAVGTVTFQDGTTVLGMGTLDGNGVATFTTSALTVGNHPINVTYPASNNFLASTAALPLPMGQEVDAVKPPPPPPPPPPGSFTLAVNPTALSIGVGNSVTAQVVVTALNGYSQPVQLTCSGLPHETTCTFVQSLIGVGGGTTGMIVSPAAPHNCGSSTPDFVAPNGKSGLVGLALGGLALFGLRRRRRLVKALVLVGAFCVLPMLGGCGSGCKDFGTEPTNYTFMVTATSVGSPVTAVTEVVALKVHL